MEEIFVPISSAAADHPRKVAAVAGGDAADHRLPALADRKIWAAVQLRRGPNVVGPLGLLQSFADLLKFVFKEPIIPSGANKGVFLLAPLVSAVLALAAWAVIPVNEGWVVANINVGILYVFAISSLEVYGIIMGGWASNSKYPFLGALRSAAQMVSYEVSIGFVIITVLLCVGSLNLTEIVMSQEDGLGTMLGLPNSFLDWHWLGAVPDVHRVLHLGAGGNQPPALRSGRSGIGTRRRLHGGIFVDALPAVHPRRICGHHPDVRADHDPLPSAAGCRPSISGSSTGSGRHLVHAQALLRASSCSPW